MKKINRQRVLWLEISLLLATLLALNINILAQETDRSAQNEFEGYARNPKFSSTPSNKIRKQGKNPLPKTANTKIQPAVKVPEKSQVATVGKPGMKIWFERQLRCEGSFSPVAPTSVFNSGDCVRARFRLNFEGYLTIVNLGSSGVKKQIFPSEGLDNLTDANSDNYLPHNGGWQFDDTAGTEQLFFVVSNSQFDKNYVNEFKTKRELITNDSLEIEIYDRDLIPRTEDNSVYILANEKRLEKVLVFRVALKHR